MKYFKRFLLCTLALSTVACSNDDDTSEEEVLPEIVLPKVAVAGFNLNTGEAPYLVQWDEAYENARVDYLPSTLDYQLSSGILNIVDGKMSIGVGFPLEEIIILDINADTATRYADFFTPENPFAGSYTLHTDDYIVTYYLDQNTCCNIFLHSYNIATGQDAEFYVGNIDIEPLVVNTYVQSNTAFVTGTDTFTGVQRLYVYDLESGIRLGAIDSGAYQGYFYDNVREAVYLFDFTGASLSYRALDLNTFSVGEAQEFIEGVTAQSNFNEVVFESDTMVFKQNLILQSAIGLSAIYNFTENTLTSYQGTDLINRIGEATGRFITITDTEVDLDKEVYIISGIYMENNVTKGLLAFMTYDREIIAFTETDNINPGEIILLE